MSYQCKKQAAQLARLVGSAPRMGFSGAASFSGPQDPSPSDLTGLKDDVSLRSSLTIAFAQALREAEAAKAAATSSKSPSEAAQAAYEQLCYDFPEVDEDALNALALVMKSNLAVTGRFPFPVTPRFVDGLSHLTRPFKSGNSAQQGIPLSTQAVQDSSASANGEHDHHQEALATISSCIFVVAPSQALATAASDGGTALRDYLGSYRAAGPTEVLEERRSDPTHCNEERPNDNPGLHEQLDDDDDSDWEPLEPDPSGPVPPALDLRHVLPSDGDALTWQELIARLTDLSSHIRYEAFSCNAVWSDPTLQLTDAVTDLVSHLQTVGERHQVGVTPALRPYLGLLTERLVTCPSGGGRLSDSIAGVVPRVLAALRPTAVAPLPLATAFLATLVVKLGERTAVGYGLLWPAVQDALPILAAHVRTLAEQSAPSHEWLAALEAVMQVLAFFVEGAPGNADIGQPLLQTGVFRESVVLFTRVGHAPPTEPLRRFLLLATAASPPLARFLASVAPFAAATTSASFLDPLGPASLHGAVWPMLLTTAAPSAPAEQAAADIVREPIRWVTGDADMNVITFAGALGRLHRFLSLLQAVVRSAPANKLIWRNCGLLENAFIDCSLKLSSLSLSTSKQRSGHGPALENVRGRLGPVHDDEVRLSSDSERDCIGDMEHVKSRDGPTFGGKDCLSKSLTQDHRSSAEEKVQEMVPAVLKQLKDVIGYGKGGALGKND